MKTTTYSHGSRSVATLFHSFLFLTLAALLAWLVRETFSFYQLFEIKTALGPALRMLP